MDLWTHFWTLYFEGKIRDLKVNIDLYTTALRKYQTMDFCYMVYIFLDPKYVSIHLNWMCRKSTPLGEYTRQWPFRKYQKMAFSYMV